MAVKRLSSQCTFWCSVLSDLSPGPHGQPRQTRLNAPFGAQCFPTELLVDAGGDFLLVSMHLLVLSAFRLKPSAWWKAAGLAVSMHLLVLSAFRRRAGRPGRSPFQPVSMHLLVLSAFRQDFFGWLKDVFVGLNAPFGAQCFPTKRRNEL